MKDTKRMFSNIRVLLSLVYKQDPVLLWLYFVTSLIGALVLFAVFFGFKLLIDAISPTSSSPLFPVVIILVTYLFFEYVSRFVYYTVNEYYLAYIFRNKTQNTLTIKIMEKATQLDLAQLEDGKIRNLLSKVFDTYAWTVPNIVSTLTYLVYNIASVLLALIVASQFNLVQFLFVAVAAVPLFYIRAKYGNAEWSIYGVQSPKANQLWYLKGLFYDNNIITEMKLYNFATHMVKKMKNLQDSMLLAYQKPIGKYTLVSILYSLVIPIALYIPLSTYLNPGSTGRTIGDFTLLLNALFNFSTQLSNMLVNIGDIYKNNLYLDDLIKFLNIKSQLPQQLHPFRFNKIEPRTITFKHVLFAYPDSKKTVLKDLSFTLERGSNIAIVGENGAGKTTLIKLLLRFYDPNEGQILIDGVDLKKIDLGKWHRHIGILFQQFGHYLFTLEENVQLGDIERAKNKKDVINALNNARAGSIIDELPRGLNNLLGKRFEEGQELSSGQWQKVAIARALYRSAPYLILDEPTANIDADSEAKIFDNLIKHYKNKSLLFISHRFSTVRHADKIIVLHKGEIEAIGTHEELISQDGLYKKFFSLQKKGYE